MLAIRCRGCPGAKVIRTEVGRMSRATAIANVRIFDGERAISDTTVLIGGARIEAVGPSVPRDAVVVDGRGATLMPGLIDSHVHTDMAGLRDALKFGVTTELEMMGRWSARRRREIAERNDFADLRSAEMGVTAKGGHPTEYMNSSSNLFIRFFYRFPSVSTPGEAARFVSRQVSRGADYIKVFIEDGSCIGGGGVTGIAWETGLIAGLAELASIWPQLM